MKNFTDHERAAIARAWPASGLTQAVFAAQHNISERALRSWSRRYASRRPPLDRVRGVVSDAVEQLHAILARLDAEALDAACHAQSQDPKPDAGNAETASRSDGETQACRAECSRCDRSRSAKPCRAGCQSEQVAPPTTSAASSPKPARQPQPSGIAGRADLDDLAARAHTELSRLGMTVAAPTAVPRIQTPSVSSASRLKIGGFFSAWDPSNEGA